MVSPGDDAGERGSDALVATVVDRLVVVGKLLQALPATTVQLHKAGHFKCNFSNIKLTFRFLLSINFGKKVLNKNSTATN